MIGQQTVIPGIYKYVFFAAAFILTAVLEAILLPILRKLKAGQSIREDGPQWHMSKAGTPTMGGLAMVAAFVLCCIGMMLFPGISDCTRTGDVLVMAATILLYGFVGFTDDYIKVMKKRNLGLTEIQKLIMQIVVALLIAVYCGKFGTYGTSVYIPFFQQYVDFGWFYYPFVIFVFVAMTNAVNLTDGLDGLASSVTAIASLPFMFIALWCSYGAESSVPSSVLAGVCCGFLVFNHYPAKVFMGDTGSLALGGVLSAIAIISGLEFILPLAGIIYVLEALSVIIQVFVYKTQNGRRFFRMAPIHHHFEKGGMKETKVVAMFCAVTAVMCVIVVLLA